METGGSRVAQPAPAALRQTDIDSPFAQLKRQREAYRTGTDDHYLMFAVSHCQVLSKSAHADAPVGLCYLA